MTFLNLYIDPFINFKFMTHTLLASVSLSLVSAPLGVFLILRRMSLIGEALSHGILPGIAIAYIIFGLSPLMMCIGAVAAGLVVLGLSHYLKNNTNLYEDASFTGLYLVSLAFGIMVLTHYNSGSHLLHLLFGSSLSVDDLALKTALTIAPISLIVLIFIYKILVIDSFDPSFAQQIYPRKNSIVWVYMTLLIANIVAAYQILGALLALGMMMLPAIAARLMFNNIKFIIMGSIFIAIIGSYIGLLLAYYFDLAGGPSVLCTYGIFIFLGFLKQILGSFFSKPSLH